MSKRIFDLLLSFFTLIFVLPLMGLSALLVYLEDGSPVIFRQKRVGRDGRLFEIYKFRTMVKNAEQLKSWGEGRYSEGSLIHKTRTTRA